MSISQIFKLTVGPPAWKMTELCVRVTVFPSLPAFRLRRLGADMEDTMRSLLAACHSAPQAAPRWPGAPAGQADGAGGRARAEAAGRPSPTGTVESLEASEHGDGRGRAGGKGLFKASSAADHYCPELEPTASTGTSESVSAVDGTNRTESSTERLWPPPLLTFA